MESNGATILVIEDNPGTAELIKEILLQEGYDPLVESSGEKGLAVVEERSVDLALLDVMLPGMDGFEVCRRLKARRATQDDGAFLPVVMLTARGTLQDVVAGLQAGADEYLRKPFEVDELLLRVRAMLRIVDNERALARRNRELEAAYAQERETRRQLEALEKLATVGLSDLPLDVMLQHLIDTMAGVAKADAGAIFLMEPDVPRLTVRAACGLAAKEEGRHEAAAQFAARIAQTGETAQKVVSMPDLSSDAAPNQRTLLGVPLTARGRRLGVATLGRPGDHAFRDDEVHLFRIMANRAALAIENAALHVRAERDLEMKTLLLRELQHRVRNNLQAISGILSFQLTRETTAQAAIKGALRRIKSISATQDFLFKREGGPIPLHPLLETVAHQLATLWALPGQEVQVTADHPDIALPMERAQIVALVVHELIANAFQHGLADQPGVIRLHISTQARGVTIEVLDPGHGLPPTFNMESASLAGLRLVQILLQREFRVGLELVASAGGTRASFTIPRAYFPTLPAPASMAVTGDRPSPPYPKGE